MGGSDFQVGRTLAGWPVDVAELADQLGIDHFFVLGTSGGGPYAAACARALPDRVIRAAIVSGLAPLDRPGALEGMDAVEKRAMLLARRAPRVARAATWLAIVVDRLRPGTIYRGLVRALPTCDRSVAGRPEVRDSLIDSYRRAFQHGTRGQVGDWSVIASPWGFRPDQIRVEVQLWHGELDDRVPRHHAEFLAEAIPNSELVVLQGEGHMIAFSHIEEILTALTAMPEEPAVSRVQEPLPERDAAVVD
jgi:pimeloyl-ACP methyl ester carboxylesterase